MVTGSIDGMDAHFAWPSHQQEIHIAMSKSAAYGTQCSSQLSALSASVSDLWLDLPNVQLSSLCELIMADNTQLTSIYQAVASCMS